MLQWLIVSIRAQGDLKSRVVRPADLTPEEGQQWEHLSETVPSLGSPFLSLGFTRAVAAVLPDVFVCVIQTRAGAGGFLPFQFRSPLHRALGYAERVGGEMSDYFGLVAPAEIRVEPQQLLELAGLRYLTFSHLDESQGDLGLQGEQPECAFRMNFASGEPYWDFLSREHKEFVSNTRRRERQVQKELGPLRFTFSESDWRQPLADLLALKSSQLLRTGHRDFFQDRWRRELVERLAASAGASCTGVLSTLHAGDTWLAAHFGLRNRGVLHYWFPVYSPELSKFSPGYLLLKAFIDSAAEQGVSLIDHGGGDARYKRECSNETHQYLRGAWERTGPAGWVCRGLSAVEWRLTAARNSLVRRGLESKSAPAAAN